MVADRIGHANMAYTLTIYTHRSTGRDQPAADKVAGLIFGDAGKGHRIGPSRRPLATPAHETAPQMISEGPFLLVAGTGFEPATSGL